MSWEIAIIFTYLGIAGLLLHIGLKGDNKQLPLKLIFITMSFGAMLYALNTCVILADYAVSIIADASVSNALISTVQSSFAVMQKVFWIFLIISFFTMLFEGVKALLNTRKK